MKHKLLLAATLFLSIATTASASDTYRRHRYNHFKGLATNTESIVFVGNSITDMGNWPEVFGNDANVVSRGVSGGFSWEVRDNVYNWIVGHPKKVFIKIGTNDLNKAEGSPEGIAANIDKTLEICQRVSPKTKVYIQSIIPCNNGSRDDARIRKSNQLLEAVCAKYDNAEYFDLYQYMGGVASGWPLGCNDNLHLTGAGYATWAHAIEDKVGLSTVYPEKDVAIDIQKNYDRKDVHGGRIANFSLEPTRSGDIIFMGEGLVQSGEWNELLKGNVVVKNHGTGWEINQGDMSMTRDIIDATLATNGTVTREMPKAIVLYTGSTGTFDADTYESLVTKIHGYSEAIKVYCLSLQPKAATYSVANNQAIANICSKYDYASYIDVATELSAHLSDANYYTENHPYFMSYVTIAQEIARQAPELGLTAITTVEAQRNYVVANAAEVVYTVKAGDGIGEYPEAAYNAVSSALSTLQSATSDAAVSTATTALTAAINDLKPQIHIPTAEDVNGRQFALSTPNRSSLYAYTDGEGLNSTNSNPGYKNYRWIFEARDDGSFNIKNADKNVYMSPTANHDSQIKMTATAPDAGWTIDYSDALGLYIIKSGTNCELNTTDKSGNPVYNWHNTSNATNRGDKGCQWLIEDVTDIPLVISPDPINVVTGTAQEGAASLVNGHIYTITNHQQDGTCYPLYVTDGLKVGQANALAAKSYGNRAQFRAIAKAGGKWAFQSVLTDQYLVWIGGSGGYNGNKGVTNDYNADYCDMTLTPASNITNGKLITGKRANNNVGTFIQNSDGTWNAWSNTNVGVSATFSNLYTFGDVTDGFDGEVQDVDDGTISVAIAYNTGTFGESGTYRKTWTSTSTAPQVTVNALSGSELVSNMLPKSDAPDAFINYTGNRNQSGSNYSSTLRVSVSSGYEIVGYAFDAALYEANTNVSITTPKGTMPLTVAKQSESYSFTTPVTEFSFTQTGQNKGAKFTGFRVIVKEKVGAQTYTIKTSRGDLFATKESELLLNTCGRNNTSLITTENAQWVLIPGTTEGTFYFYNVFTDKFIGAPSASDASKLTMSDKPTTTYYKWESNRKQGYPWTISDGPNASSNMLNVTDWNNNGVGYIFGKSSLDDGNEFAIEPAGAISQEAYDALLQRIDEYTNSADDPVAAYITPGKYYYIYNDNDSPLYLFSGSSALGVNPSSQKDPAFMWKCIKNGEYYNFQNAATGLYLAHKGQQKNAYNFKIDPTRANTEGCLPLYSVAAERYFVLKYTGAFDQGTGTFNKNTTDFSTDFVFEETDPMALFFSPTLADATWVRITNKRSSNYVLTTKDGDAAGTDLHSATADTGDSHQLFALVGTAADGFLIYNKEMGALTLTAANTNSGTPVKWAEGTPTKWYLRTDHFDAKGGYMLTPSTTAGTSMNMYGGTGHDIKFYDAPDGDGGSLWTISLVDDTPTIINYVVRGEKKYADANQWLGRLNISKGSFSSSTLVRADVDGTTFKAYLPKSDNAISITNSPLHGWLCDVAESEGVYTVTYTADQRTEYQYLGFEPSTQIYRIPALVRAQNDDLVAIYDYRVCHNDVGFGEVDQVMRRSTDNGKTWSEEEKIADGNGGGKVFGAAFGDPALVADADSPMMTLITVSGTTVYIWATETDHNLVSVQHSYDNGKTWTEPKNITDQFWGKAGGILADGDDAASSEVFAYSGFFGSGKLMQSRHTKVGKYRRIYGAMLCQGKGVRGAYVVYSDDMGDTWKLLGGNNKFQAAPGSDEPKVEELPNGDVVLSCRKGGGRIFNVWRWSTMPTESDPLGQGAWGSPVDSNNSTTCPGGISVGGNSCNGEILLVDAVKADGTPAKLMLQSLPAGGTRTDVEIWYKDVTDQSAYATNQAFGSNWTRGLRVSNTDSAYSTMCMQADGRIGFFYEEGPATYCMVYVPLLLSEITDGAYEGPQGWSVMPLTRTIEKAQQGKAPLDRVDKVRDLILEK